MDQRSRVLRLARDDRGPITSPPLKGLGFRSTVRDGVRTVVEVSGAAAERAGIRAGDEVVAVDGRPAAGFSGDEWRARANAPAPLSITLRRAGRDVAIELTPEVFVR